MVSGVELTRRCARLKALPRRPTRGHPLRFSVDDRPAPPAQGPVEPREGAAQRRVSLPSGLRGVRVLVVDDDEETIALFEAVLAACGADVVTANSAPAALRVLDARSVDVVVSDIAMPGADGYWLVREIRRLTKPSINSVPVVAVTAFGREHGRGRTLAGGFADHLEKPVDPEVLCRTVAKAAGR